jgi:hypothetical protein
MTITCLPELSPQEQWDQLQRMFSANVLGGAPVIPESNEWYVIGNDYLVNQTIRSLMQTELQERDPRYACCDNLINLASYDRIYPRPARAAQGYMRVSGTTGAAIPSPLQFSLVGQAFTSAPDAVIPATMPATGSFTVRAVADVAGTSGNITATAASTTELQTAVAGLTRAVVLEGGKACGGLEAETCEEFRRRYLARIGYRPRLSFDLVSQWILDDWPCATRVCVRGCCGDEEEEPCGAAPLRLYVMFEGTWDGGAAPASVITELNTWLWGETPGLGQGRAPIGMCGEVYPYTLGAVSLTLEGVACLAPEVQAEIRRRLNEYFSALCPNVSVCEKDVIAIAAQVAGSPCPIEATFSTTATTVTVDDCGSVVPDCDVRLILSSLTFA